MSDRAPGGSAGGSADFTVAGSGTARFRVPVRVAPRGDGCVVAGVPCSVLRTGQTGAPSGRPLG
jgi:hypothetical protein